MRIIRGTWKGRRLNPPNNLPVRPTTDMAKEALFNVLENNYELSMLNILDLFAGTGSISYEFASRGAKRVTAVEQNFRCTEFIRKTKETLRIENLQIVRADVFQFLKKTIAPFDLIFADPPYDLPGLETLPGLVFEQNLLSEAGIFILEHPDALDFSLHPHFSQHRHYGKVNFTFFENQESTNTVL